MRWHVAKIRMHCITLCETSLAMIYPFEVALDCVFCGRIDRTILFDSIGKARCTKCDFFDGYLTSIRHRQSIVVPGSIELSPALQKGRHSLRDFSESEQISIKGNFAIKHELNFTIVYRYRRFIDRKFKTLSTQHGMQEWARVHFVLICTQCGTCSSTLSIQSNQERQPYWCSGCGRVLMIRPAEPLFGFFAHYSVRGGNVQMP